ncbi:MAG: hypothetical protein R3B09_33795 [Nannocystaceae bacterium]
MNLRNFTSLTSFALSLALVGCIGDDKDDATDTAASSSGATETTGGSTAGTSTEGTAGTDGTAGSGTDSATSTTAGTTTAGMDSDGTTLATTAATTADPTTGTTAGTTGDSGIPESCDKACELVYGCFPEEFESKDECVMLCIDESSPAEPDDACEAAAVALNECIAALSCLQLMNPNGEPCADEQGVFDEVCGGGDVCSIGIGGDANSCGISQECPDSSQALECEGELCRCLEDGVEINTCPNDVCSDEIDFDALSKKALECCGFDL